MVPDTNTRTDHEYSKVSSPVIKVTVGRDLQLYLIRFLIVSQDMTLFKFFSNLFKKLKS